MIYLVRHGQTEFNRDGRYQGGRDSALTDTGREQARQIGLKLRDLIDPGFGLVSSPLGRAVATAEIVRETSGLAGDIALDRRLAEVSLGDWDGLTRIEIEALAGGGATTADWLFTAPGGERIDAVEARLRRWLAETEGRDLIAVTHGVVGRTLRGLYAGLPREEAMRLEVTQSAFFRLDGGRIERIAVAA